MPYPGNNGVTEPTSISGEIISGDIVPLPLDEHFTALMAIGVIPFMVGDVAHIDIANPLVHGDFSESGQSRHRCGRKPVEFVAWKEA